MLSLSKIMNWIAICLGLVGMVVLYRFNANENLGVLALLVVPNVVALIAFSDNAALVAKYLGVVANATGLLFWAGMVAVISIQGWGFAIVGIIFSFLYLLPTILNIHVLYQQVKTIKLASAASGQA